MSITQHYQAHKLSLMTTFLSGVSLTTFITSFVFLEVEVSYFGDVDNYH